MTYYRLYFMHPMTGHIERFAELDAPDDETATDLAREHVGEFALELWTERRKVVHLSPVALTPSNIPATGSR